MTSAHRSVGGAIRSLFMVVTLLLASLAMAPQAQAVNLVTPFSNMMWAGTGHLYVQAGETVTLDLRGRGGSYTATMTDGTPVTFTNPVTGAASGTPCAAPCAATVTATATTAGVWTLTSSVIEPYTSVSTYPQVITVSSADGTEIPGRFWTERLVGSQHRYGVADVSLWAVSAVGSQYQINLLGLSGWGTVLQFNNRGVMKVGTCESAYLSVPTPGSDREPAGSTLSGSDYTVEGDSCPNLVPYRLFAEPPADDLPTSTTRWADNRTTNQWVLPSYRTPTLSPVTHTPDGSASHAGTLSFTLTGQPGTVNLGLDVDGDGTLTGPRDVTLPSIAASVGTHTMHWDGRDGLGNLVPTSEQVPVLATYSGQDEVHLTLTDLEGLWGGIELRAVNGPEAGSTAASWDDSHLLVRPVDQAGPPTPAAATDADTTGGVRGWGRPTSGLAYGWGDQRSMDTWTMSTERVTATGLIGATAPDLVVTKSVASATVAAGGNTTFTVTVTNRGTADVNAAAPATVTDEVVQHAEAVQSIDQVTASSGSATAAATSVVWHLDDLAVGATATLTYRVTANPVTSSTAVDNWAYLSAVRPTTCDSDRVCAAASVVVTPTSTSTPTTTPTSTPTGTPTTTPTSTPTSTPTPLPSSTPTRSGGVEPTAVPPSDSPGTPAGTPTARPSGPLPDTGAGSRLLPLVVLGALLTLGGLWALRRPSRSRH